MNPSPTCQGATEHDLSGGYRGLTTALRRLPRCVGFYRIFTAGIDSAHDFKAQQALAENSALTRS